MSFVLHWISEATRLLRGVTPDSQPPQWHADATALLMPASPRGRPMDIMQQSYTHPFVFAPISEAVESISQAWYTAIVKAGISNSTPATQDAWNVTVNKFADADPTFVAMLEQALRTGSETAAVTEIATAWGEFQHKLAKGHAKAVEFTDQTLRDAVALAFLHRPATTTNA